MVLIRSCLAPTLQSFVVDLRQRGVKPISCNTHIKALNAFCRWLHEEQHLPHRLELSCLKVEKRILQTLTDEQIRALLAVPPKSFDQWRLHALISFLLDTGVRIDEALTLRTSDIDFDNLLLTVFGKGRKERRIPFSFELRKVLFRWQQVRQRTQPRCQLVFPSRQGTAWVSGIACAGCTCYRNGRRYRRSAGTGSGTRSLPTTFATAVTSSGSRWCSATRRSRPRSVTSIC
jgi:site-specific recombinase XerD